MPHDQAVRDTKHDVVLESPMSIVRIALANLRPPTTPAESVQLAIAAIGEASRQQARVLCFPECFVPGYRWPDATRPAPERQRSR